MDLDLDRSSLQPLTLQDLGGILAAVAVGGTAFYFLKGVSSCRKGRRLEGGAKAVVANAPQVARWTGWCGAMATIQGGMECACGVDCPWKGVVAFGGASALFSVRQGPRAAVRSGLKGAALGAVVEKTVYGLDSLFGLLETRSSGYEKFRGDEI